MPSEESISSHRGVRALGWYGAAALAGVAVCVYLATWGRRYGLDLRVYRDSAAAFDHGHDPYLSTFTASRLAFTYPPFALVVLSSLTLAPLPVTQWLLWMVSIGAVTTAVAVVLVDRGWTGRASLLWCGSLGWACLSILLFEPARSGVDYGQIECVLMAVVVADLLVVPRRYRGIATGIAAAIKLTPLIFVVVLAVRRDWWSVVRVALSFVAWSALTWLLWPELSDTFWRHDVVRPGRTGNVAFRSNQSWYAVLHRPPFAAAGSAPAWLALSMVTVAIGTLIAWRCVSTDRQAFAVLAIALVGLLVSPISWSHHWIWVVLIPPALVGRRRHEMGRMVRAMLWGIVALTIAAPYWWFSTGWTGAGAGAVLPVWTFATLLVWCWTEVRGRRHPVDPSDAPVVEPAAA